MKNSVILTPPALEPVSRDEFKAHARVDNNEEDTLIDGLIKAARHWCERYLRRVLIHQDWVCYVDDRPDGAALTLPMYPLVDVQSVTSFADDDTATTWENSQYYADTISAPGRIVLRSGGTWPDFTRRANGMMITYRAGYGATAEDVPEPIRLAIKQLTLHWFEHRGEALIEGAANKVPMTVEALLQPYRSFGLGGS